jgi:hypothetical protein
MQESKEISNNNMQVEPINENIQIENHLKKS